MPWDKISRVLEGKKVSNQGWILAFGILASMGILAFLIMGNVKELIGVLGRTDYRWVLAALAASMLSYLMIGFALREVLHLLGYELSFPEVFGIAFVSTTANYFVSSAGVSGFALKAHLLRKRGVPYGTTVTASVVSTAILYGVLALIIFQGLGYMILRMGGTQIPLFESVLGLGALGITAVPLMMFFFNRELRGRMSRTIFEWANYGAYLFSTSEIPRADFERFLEQLDKGLDLIREDKGRLTKAIGYTCLDWGFSMVTLYCGFRAVGWDLSVGHLSTGFAVGQAATLIPILPAGLGAMEGSMAAVYEGLNIDWEAAMIAALIFRFAYHVVPVVCSIFLLWGLKMSEPTLIEDTVMDTLPEELKIKAEQLEKKFQHEHTHGYEGDE